MHEGTELAARVEGLPGLIKQAAAALASASTAAEVLEAKHLADAGYIAAKETARFAKVKDAHDTIVATCHRAMGDALIIEHQAACRLADEYDLAQKRGEVAGPGGTGSNQYGNIQVENISTVVGDIGLTNRIVHESRLARDGERRQPGVVEQIVEAKLAANSPPTKADVRRAVTPPKPVRQTDLARPVPEPQQAAAENAWYEPLWRRSAYLLGAMDNITPKQYLDALIEDLGPDHREPESVAASLDSEVYRFQQMREWLDEFEGEVADERERLGIPDDPDE